MFTGYIVSNILAPAGSQFGTSVIFLADAPAMYCAYNKLVSQDRQVVGKEEVMLVFCFFRF